MTIETPLPVAEEARPQLPAGFPPGSTVDVRQVHDQDWETLRALTYHVTREDFEVPVRERTGFASVPRMFVWFITRYGRYAKTVRLRDYLCSVAVPADRIGRIDADGIFPQANAGTRRLLPAPLDHVGPSQAGRPDQYRWAQEVVD